MLSWKCPSKFALILHDTRVSNLVGSGPDDQITEKVKFQNSSKSEKLNSRIVQIPWQSVLTATDWHLLRFLTVHNVGNVPVSTDWQSVSTVLTGTQSVRY